MTADGRGPFSPRLVFVLLAAAPLLLALSVGTGLVAPGARPDDPRELIRREEGLHESFVALLDEASALTAMALERSPAAAWREAGLRPEGIGGRLEGVGILGPDLVFSRWRGTPVDPDPGFAEADWPDWTVRVEGVRTRLVVRAGPDDHGRWALAAFVIDSALPDRLFAALLPGDVTGGIRLDATFFDTGTEPLTAADAGLEAEAPGLHLGSLRSPAGDVMAFVRLTPVPAERRLLQLRQVGRAWSIVLTLLLAAGALNWKAVCARAWGLGAVAIALAAGRAALLWQEVPARLLPRAIGAPSVYGSSAAWDLLFSPADLLLTALAIYTLCLAFQAWAGPHLAGGGWRLAPLIVLAAAGATVVSAGLTLSLARNSRVPLLDRPAPFELDARLLLWVGLLLLLIGAAQLWALAFALLPRAPGPARPLVTILILLALVSGSSFVLQRQSDRLAVEQLESEFAREVLEQGPRRRLALTAAMRGIIASFPARPAARSGDAYLAYREWVRSELFHSRTKSSLDFYTPEGELISHFGFGLPPLEDSLRMLDRDQVGLLISEEWIDSVGAQPRLLHAEAPRYKDGQLQAIVVGHVLDEPDNLPFLPWSQTYLAALGPGLDRSSADMPGGELQYVLYDGYGAVRLTTLLQPPAETVELRAAAAKRETIRVTAGGESYVALALEEPTDRRLHLLLLARRSPAERIGAAVRLALLGLLLASLIELTRRAFRPGGLSGLLPMLRASFYRKLLAAVLLASVPTLVALALFVGDHIERRGDAELIATATQFVRTAQRVVEDYSAGTTAGEGEQLNDAILHWLRRVVGQEIHVYRNNKLLATSTRELFTSGLLEPRLDGDVHERLVREGLPYVVAQQSIGPGSIPVAYAPVRRPGAPTEELIVAVPLVLEQRKIAQSVSRVGEMILLATVLLAGLLALAAAALARTVARPVRELVDATGRIAAGDYEARLDTRTHDEVAELVEGFNQMGSALARTRDDLERRRDYIETLLRHATTAVISLDTAGRIVTLNPAAAALLDTPGDRAAGRPMREVLRDSAELEPLARALERTVSGEPVDVDLIRGDEPRRYRWVRVQLRKADEGSFGSMILLDDVTDLMRSNQLAAWAEMARAIAHEIKNPLTPIQLSTEHLGRLLRDRGHEPSEAEQACLETIIKQVRALYDIAGEFSSYAKLPVLDPRPTDPVGFMREAIAPYRASCPPGVTIDERYESAPRIAVDGKVLSRAVINLVENALQAMPDGGTLTVGVGADGASGSVELSVADTGPGLEAGVRVRLFEPYFSTKSSGTGLGLAIARRAVEAHGGTIEVCARAERGTLFRIRIPIHGYTSPDG